MGYKYMELFYDNPAREWEAALPIGNGSLGGLICGGVKEERIALNEESVWSGYAEDKTNPDAYKYLNKVRRLVGEERYFDAEKIVSDHMLGKENETYLPLGTLKLRYTYEKPGKTAQTDESDCFSSCTAYRRNLDINQAVAGVWYTLGGVKYTREIFASYPQQAIYLLLTSDQLLPALDIMFETQLQTSRRVEGDVLYLQTKAPEHVVPAARVDSENAFVQGDRGMEFSSCIEILETDGQSVPLPDGLRVEEAKRIIIRFSAVRTPGEERSYQAARAGHIADYRSLYDRVELSLGDAHKTNMPVDERLRRLTDGEEDPQLYALYFQYGRYLLISSSRPGSLPANLQGIWNWKLHAPWRSAWTTNINFEMNYWHVHSCNLWECFEPYISFMQKVCENGQKTAEVNYGCRGFTVHHNVDRWYSTTPVGITWEGTLTPNAAGWGMWPMGGVWLTDLLFCHYYYTKDEEYLRNQAFPIIRQSVLFVLDWVYEENGVFHTCPSTSPENRFLDKEGRSCSISRSSTMDITLIRMILEGYCDVCRILACEDGLCSRAKEVIDKLPRPQISKDGRLLEWEKDFTPREPGHRHISHLYGLFPGDLFECDEELRDACRVSLEHRLKNGGGHTGWSLAWILNVYAVLEDSTKFGEGLKRLLTHSTYPNLWDAHPPFQIDGNFGGAAAIANMLVHERNGHLKLLPGLPSMFGNGYVRGLCLPGNRTIDIEWANGEVKNYQINPRK